MSCRRGWLRVDSLAASGNDAVAEFPRTLLEYAFPKAFARASAETPGLLAHRERIFSRPRPAAYLASDRRMPFNEDGIFRRYPELDDR